MNNNKLKIFENEQFGSLRTVEQDGKAWFVGKDVAEALGYKKPENAIATHVDEEDKTTTLIQGSGSNYKSNAVVINESGLYSLILSSKLESAKAFKRWVTSEVLPSIRKDGAYVAATAEESDEDIMARAVLAAQRRIAERDAKIKELEATNEANAPKALFADAVSASKSSVLVGELAKLMRQNGLEIGRQRLFELLRRDGFLMKQGGAWNMPTQKAVEMGLVVVKESTRVDPDGTSVITRTPKITGKGQVYFVNRYLRPELEKREQKHKTPPLFALQVETVCIS